MKTYTVLSRLNHDGKVYERGDQVDMNPKEDGTKDLLIAKVISGDKIPVVVEADWKKGPKSDAHTADKDTEINDDTAEDADEDEEEDSSEEDTIDNKIAGVKDENTNKIKEDADKDL